jgi:hypothetical protein
MAQSILLITHTSTFPACGAVTLIPLSNLFRVISKFLQTHHVRTVLIAFLISLPFNSHLANSLMSFSLTLPSALLPGRRDRNFCQIRRRDEKGRDSNTRWMFTRDRKAVSIVEYKFVVKKMIPRKYSSSRRKTVGCQIGKSG